ncbi:MAG: folate-binding protein, partial [Propionibacteriaceae bacterium]|nr:folate-binding protein [Propionibacteriaceae bacterium]
MTMARVAAGPDTGLPWHYGDPLAEQRRLERGDGLVDLSNRDILVLTGADRLAYLDRLSTQRLADLAPGQAAVAYLLDAQGHIVFDLHLTAADDAVWLWTEPGRGPALAAWLDERKFRAAVTVAYRPDYALLWQADPTAATGHVVRRGPDSLGGAEWFAPRSDLPALLEAAAPAGVWAWEARRIAAGLPRIGVDTDERTLPNELGVPSAAVSLDKGCYPGQETVARVYHLGRPPRRLVR